MVSEVSWVPLTVQWIAFVEDWRAYRDSGKKWLESFSSSSSLSQGSSGAGLPNIVSQEVNVRPLPPHTWGATGPKLDPKESFEFLLMFCLFFFYLPRTLTSIGTMKFPIFVESFSPLIERFWL